jgi:HEAT repeat protein
MPNDLGDTRRPRAVLAALCLAAADPVHVTEHVVDLVLSMFVAQIDARLDGRGTSSPTSLDAAARELAGSVWARKLCQGLVSEQAKAEPELAQAIEGVIGIVATHDLLEGSISNASWLKQRETEMRSPEIPVVVTAVLGMMYAAFLGYHVGEPEVVARLIVLLDGETVVARAAAWALDWFSERGGAAGPIFVGMTVTAFYLDARQIATMVELCEKDNADPVVRRRLMLALASIGDPRVLDIARGKLESDAASDPSASPLRPAAVRVIGEFGRRGELDRESGYELLRPHLNDPSLRSSTARALGALGNLDAIGLLTPLVEDPDERVRASVAYALGELFKTRWIRRETELRTEPVASAMSQEAGDDSAVDDAVSALITRLDEDISPQVRSGAAWALGEVRARGALAALGERIARTDEDIGVRRAAAGALGLIGGRPAVMTLGGMLGDPDVRRQVAQALADMNEADAAEVLLARVANGDTDLLTQTTRAIKYLDTARCLQRVKRMPVLTNPEAIRHAAVELTVALARRNEPQHADDIRHIIKQLVADPELAIRRGILETGAFELDAGLAGWLDDQALTALVEDPDPAVAQQALRQLRPLPDDRALRILDLALGREEPEVLASALTELRGRDITAVRNSAALAALGERLARTDEDIDMRRAAVAALGLIGGGSAVTALGGTLDDPDLRGEAAQALADMNDADASDVLLARVANGDTDLLTQTLRAIEYLDTARCLERLNRMIALTNPEAVRGAAAQIAAELTQRDEPQHADDVRRIINQLLTDPEAAIRRSILEAGADLAGWLDDQPLTALVEDPDPIVAQLALSQLRPLPDDPALPIPAGGAEVLATASRHPTASVRAAAIAGLLRWRAAYVVTRLQSDLLEVSHEKRARIIAALRRSDDGPVTNAFLDRLLDHDPTVRSGAASSIGRLDYRRLESVLSLVSDQEPAAWMLANDILRDLCRNDPVDSLRRLACRALHELGDAYAPEELAAGRYRLAFIVLLHDADDAEGLARLFDDLQQPNVNIATFAAPPTRGMAFFTDSEKQPELDRWWGENVAPGALPVYLLMDEGSPDTLQELHGRLYVGLPDESAKLRYAQSSKVQPFVAGGPLDFATIVMMDFSSEDATQLAVFDSNEAQRMATLASDFPIDLDSEDSI